jgi:hypothetical protein
MIKPIMPAHKQNNKKNGGKQCQRINKTIRKTEVSREMARCKICKAKFEPRYFLQKACLDPACLAEWSRKDIESKINKKYKDKKRELKDNDRSVRTKAAQKAFNAFIRAKLWFICYIRHALWAI